MSTEPKKESKLDQSAEWVVHRPCSAWGCLWRSKNKLDGLREHLLYDGPKPALFRDRKAAREHIKSKYGWRLPIAVRVEIRVKPNVADQGAAVIPQSTNEGE